MARGIKDKVVILGMGCTKFDEHWDRDADSLAVEAYGAALRDAGIDNSEIDAAWLGVAQDQVNIGASAVPLSIALRLNSIPVTKVENFCASGTEALRGAVYAVASGASDIALALGVKIERHGLWRLAGAHARNQMGPCRRNGFGARKFCATGRGIRRQASGRCWRPKTLHGSCVGQKSRQRVAKSESALRNKIDIEKAINAPMIASPLGF